MRGLSKRTTKLGFNILRLHYSCDSDKDPSTPIGKRWYEEARRGMSDARFRQEYELDYGALGGQRVFPDFEETTHVLLTSKTCSFMVIGSVSGKPVWTGLHPQP